MGGSQLILGGVDDTLYTGELNYHYLTSEDYFTFQLDAVKVDGRSAVSTISAILDSGTSLIAFPQEQVQAITSMIGGYVAQDCSNLDSLRTITFVIGGIDYPLTPRQYVLQENGYCQLGIQPSSTVIIGDVFMRQYYSVFDMEQNRIGLAKAASADESSGANA